MPDPPAPGRAVKKIADIRVGARRPVLKVVVRKIETETTWEIEYDDGTVERFPKEGDPAFEVEE